MKKSAFVVLASFLMFVKPANASISWYGGGALGMGEPSAGDFGSQMAIGGHIGFVFLKQFSFGLGILSMSKTSKANGTDVRFSVSPAVFDLKYYFMEKTKSPFIGLSFGQVSESLDFDSSGSSAVVSEYETTYGIVGGYHHAVAKKHTIGGELRYLQVSGNPEDYSIFSLTVVYTYWWGEGNSDS